MHLAIIGAIKDGLALAEVFESCQCVLFFTVEASDEGLCASNSNVTASILNSFCADGGPSTLGPHAALDLAALGHLKAVERVAVGPEQASHEVVATAELPTLGVKLLPPIFVVAVSNGGLDLVRSSTFARLFTLAEIYVVQSISLAVGAEPSHEVALFAHRPRKLVEEV
jgi:hypothetical protein